MNNPLLRTAQQLAAHGRHIFPCLPGLKKPAISRWQIDATTDQDQIAAWWAEQPDYNVALATGPASGVFAVDVDSPEAEHELARLEAEHGTIPSTTETVTSRGRHLFFRWSDKNPVRNTAGKIAPGIDTRGQGGFTLMPPSLHPSGKRYAWSVDSARAVAEAPDWLLARITGNVGRSGERAATSPTEWAELFDSVAPEGARNNTVTRLAGFLIRRQVGIVNAGILLCSWARTHCTPPLTEDEVTDIVASVARSHLRNYGPCNE